MTDDYPIKELSEKYPREIPSTQVTPAHDVWVVPTDPNDRPHWQCVAARLSNAVGTVIITEVGEVYQNGPLGRDDLVVTRRCNHDR